MITDPSLVTMMNWKFDGLFRELATRGFSITRGHNVPETPGFTSLMQISATQAERVDMLDKMGIEDKEYRTFALELVPGFYVVSVMNDGTTWVFWHEKLEPAEVDYCERVVTPVDAVPMKTEPIEEETVGLEDIPELPQPVCQIPDCGCSGLAHA